MKSSLTTFTRNICIILAIILISALIFGATDEKEDKGMFGGCSSCDSCCNDEKDEEDDDEDNAGNLEDLYNNSDEGATETKPCDNEKSNVHGAINIEAEQTTYSYYVLSCDRDTKVTAYLQRPAQAGYTEESQRKYIYKSYNLKKNKELSGEDAVASFLNFNKICIQASGVGSECYGGDTSPLTEDNTTRTNITEMPNVPIALPDDDDTDDDDDNTDDGSGEEGDCDDSQVYDPTNKICVGCSLDGTCQEACVIHRNRMDADCCSSTDGECLEIQGINTNGEWCRRNNLADTDCNEGCTDDDEGQEFYISGWVYGIDESGEYMGYGDLCNPETNVLTEYFCDPDGQHIRSTTFDCSEFGTCINGACVDQNP